MDFRSDSPLTCAVAEPGFRTVGVHSHVTIRSRDGVPVCEEIDALEEVEEAPSGAAGRLAGARRSVAVARAPSPAVTWESPDPMKERTLDGFGDRLAELRQRRGLTQTALGAAVGVSKRVIAYYEADGAARCWSISRARSTSRPTSCWASRRSATRRAPRSPAS